MTKQPNRNNPPTRPENMDPSAPHLGPVAQKTAKRGWLPILLWGGISLAIIAAAGFAAYSFFFYRPEISLAPPEATPTFEVIKFNSDAQGQPATATAVQPVAEQPTETTTDTPMPVAEQPTVEQPTAEQPKTEPPSPPTDTPTPQPEPAAEPVTMRSPDYGIQAFLYWRPEVAARDLQLIEDINFSWVKQQIGWRDIEGAGKGIYDWAKLDRLIDQVNEHNLNLIARVDLQPSWAGGGYPEIGPPDNYQDYVDFLVAVATRYKGRIAAYQIWNEPNLAREWGNRPPNPAEYTELLRLSYQALKSVDPHAYVITAGLAPTTRWDDVAVPDTVFVQGMYDAGAKPYFDALGVHGAGYKVPPDTDPAVVANDPALNNNDPSPTEMKRIYAFRHIEDVREIMVQNGDADKRVVVLEFGWTVDPREDSPYRWHAVSENEQAAYIVGAYRYAEQNWQPWIGVMSLIFLANVDWTEDDEQTYWSITHPLYPDLRARPAYWGLMDAGKNRQ